MVATTPTRIYVLLATLCVAGYIWLLLDWVYPNATGGYGVCMFRNITGIPCPACGSTRAVKAIISGMPGTAFHINPLGFVVLAALIILPILLVRDLLLRTNTIYTLYNKMETIFRRPLVATAGALLLLANWIWNIQKGI